ncbi:MAG TPA: hypothetical protein VH916_11705 [Dehalococcoidia bacterium]|jgi:hypothetical protein
MTQLLAVDPEQPAGLPAVAAAFPAAPLVPLSSGVPVEPTPRLRCRLGFHRWLPLALSVHGAGAGLFVAFCRDCPQVRRPARLG